jgi:hypothetical protein
MCKKMITIGSMGSAPHIREINRYQKCLPFSFFFFDTPTAQTGIATWTIMPQSTQIFSRKYLLGVWIFAIEFVGVKFAPQN